jgi:hypothetical protein
MRRSGACFAGERAVVCRRVCAAGRGTDPEGHRDTVTESKLGSAFFAEAGLPSAVSVGAFFDLFPVSVLTTSTLDRLNELRPESQFDERRFA